MTVSTKVKLSILGDLLLLLVFSYIPLVWLKVALMVLVGVDLGYGLGRWGWALRNQYVGYANVTEYGDDELEHDHSHDGLFDDDEQDELNEQEQDTTI